jgi:hypothetical protein
MAGGRPTTYTVETAERICAGIARAIPLVKICDMDGMPDPSTVYAWLRVNEEFSKMYARAREDQADFLASEIIDIADNGALDHNDRKVRVDARKWIAAKLKPRNYGERLDVGNADDKPLNIVITR